MSHGVNTNNFKLRLTTTYADPDNSVASVSAEVHGLEGWKPLDLSTGTPGFLVFVYAVLACQHLYMRVNCAERGLMLESAVGTIDMETEADWLMTKMNVAYEGKLKSGAPTADDIAYVIGRMKQCPVSKNLKEPQESQTTLKLS
ncbi:MAG: hypothetical protein DRJ42_07285 [Deltaproteobacteria bacterium]|nr:MAG: hypothetical protein DRJ42_07285 [Deltaproteobacteria bacterium]